MRPPQSGAPEPVSQLDPPFRVEDAKWRLLATRRVEGARETPTLGGADQDRWLKCDRRVVTTTGGKFLCDDLSIQDLPYDQLCRPLPGGKQDIIAHFYQSIRGAEFSAEVGKLSADPSSASSSSGTPATVLRVCPLNSHVTKMYQGCSTFHEGDSGIDFFLVKTENFTGVTVVFLGRTHLL